MIDLIVGIMTVVFLIVCLCILNEIVKERWERIIFTIMFTVVIAIVSVNGIAIELFEMALIKYGR